ncbi:MAG: hypothetical protein K0U41_03555 [Gammaproteobacteria bacterium]|nr:hypothetical protein [Gammaproteobacteria bacterium]
MTRQDQIDASYNKLHGKRGIWRKPIGSLYYWYRLKRGNMLTLSYEGSYWYRASYNREDYTFICYNITTAKRIAILWAKLRMKR